MEGQCPLFASSLPFIPTPHDVFLSPTKLTHIRIWEKLVFKVSMLNIESRFSMETEVSPGWWINSPARGEDKYFPHVEKLSWGGRGRGVATKCQPLVLILIKKINSRHHACINIAIFAKRFYIGHWPWHCGSSWRRTHVSVYASTERSVRGSLAHTEVTLCPNRVFWLRISQLWKSKSDNKIHKIVSLFSMKPCRL